MWTVDKIGTWEFWGVFFLLSLWCTIMLINNKNVWCQLDFLYLIYENILGILLFLVIWNVIIVFLFLWGIGILFSEHDPSILRWWFWNIVILCIFCFPDPSGSSGTASSNVPMPVINVGGGTFHPPHGLLLL